MNMKKILALSGPHNSGKTTTILLLIDLLSGKGHNKKLIHDWKNDQIVIFEIEKQKIGLTTRGDNYEIVFKDLSELIIVYKCNVCITACRRFDMKGHGTHAAIKHFTKYEPIFISKTIDNNKKTQDQTNLNDAKVLLKNLEKLIK